VLDDLEVRVHLLAGAEFRCLRSVPAVGRTFFLSSGYQCHVGQSGRMVRLAINLHLLTSSCSSMACVVSFDAYSRIWNSNTQKYI